MKRSITILGPSALAVAMLAACASKPAQAPSELEGAREAYARAEAGPAAQYDRSGLIEARQALDAAELKFDESAGAEEVKTLGYVAQRKAEMAEVNGRAAAAAAAETKTAQGEAKQQKATAERSERRAKVALGRLGLAAKDEPRGTVITLPTSNMFKTNEAEILPEAKARLGEVAKAVKQVAAENAPQDVGRKIMLIGYTDDRGSEEHNMDLSKKRAEAVRTFFTEHGIQADRMEAEGRGEADPIADNKTAEGRAKNRRVDVVVTPPAKTP